METALHMTAMPHSLLLLLLLLRVSLQAKGHSRLQEQPHCSPAMYARRISVSPSRKYPSSMKKRTGMLLALC
jgi:hypothetical protein